MSASETLTVALEGPQIPLSSFSTAISALDGLLKALTAEVAAQSVITWEVESLETSSAIATVRGSAVAGDPEGVTRVSVAYGVIGDALSRHSEIPYSSKVRRHARTLTKVLADSVTAIRLETPARDFTITRPGETPVEAAYTVDMGAIEGRIQTLSNRRSLHFTLYDTLNDRAVSCYLKLGDESMIQKYWGSRALVEGTIRRDASGRPVTIRDITDIVLLPERAPDEWLSTRGAMADVWDGEPAEVTIRKIRDAW
jgi:hypothetical protein